MLGAIGLYKEAQGLILAILVSFTVVLAMGPATILALLKRRAGQTIRQDGPQTHLKKQGVPTMGGLMILCGLFLGCALFFRGAIDLMLPAALLTLGYAAVGFADDYIKVIKKRSLGLRPWEKIVSQLVLSLIFALYCYKSPAVGTTLYVPFLNAEWNLGWAYIPLVMFIVIATGNSTNLIDGADGLSTTVILILSATFSVILLSMNLAGYVPLPLSGAMSARGYGERIYNLMIFSGSLTGALLGFLRYNAHPARIIMGDTGAMALGGAVAAMAVLSRTALLLPLAGGMLVATSLSDILQILWLRYKRRRLFRMAPLHHHLELCGMSETAIVAVYGIATAVLCLLTLLLLK